MVLEYKYVLCKKGGAILMSLFKQIFKSNIYFYFNTNVDFLFFCIENLKESFDNELISLVLIDRIARTKTSSDPILIKLSYFIIEPTSNKLEERPPTS